MPSEPLIVRLEPAASDADNEAVRRFLYTNRLPLLVGLLLGVAAGIAVRIVAQPVFQARALVMPTQSNSGSGLESLVSQFGGLASLASVSLDDAGTGAAARALLDSHAVAARMIERHQLLPELFPKAWDKSAKGWRVEEEDVPSPYDGAKKLLDDHVSLDESRGSNQVAVLVRWPDAKVAAALANDLVSEVNSLMRTKAIQDARASLQYLTAELGKTNVVGVQQAIGRVAEEQLKTIVLASSREDYALTVLDPAVPPSRRDVFWPRLGPLAITGAFGGVLAGVLFAIGRGFLKRRSAVHHGADPA